MVEVISDEEWGALVDEWEKIGPAYQIPRRSRDKLEFFVKHGLPYFKGKNVLEIGCNAGIFGLHIAEEAESYVGVEPANLLKYPRLGQKAREAKLAKSPPKTDYFKQALVTLKQMPVGTQIVNTKIKDFISCREAYNYNAFFACYALYHFTNTELDALSEYIWPECDVVLIQTRHQKRPTRHNKYNFWQPKNVERFFEKLGFGVHTIKPPRSNHKPTPFSIQVCQRRSHDIT